MKDIETLNSGANRLSTSTLYEGLSRLLEAGLIERVDSAQPATNLRLRKAYRLSRHGRLALEAETARMQRLVERARLRIPKGVA